jgi:redox-sensitive bicupin YhaK (pirin superfamily)
MGRRHRYVHARLATNASLSVDQQHAERGVYVVSGAVSLAPEGEVYGEGTLLILPAGVEVTLSARDGADVMVLGGAPLDGDRHIYWNFVSSRRERIEQAKRDWDAGHFGLVVGDEHERIPLPADVGTPR